MPKNYSSIRINKDILEITKSPIEGIGIISLDNNPKEYIVNTRIMSGIYEGYCLQMLLTFPENYPIFPPKILIYPGQRFDNTYHHHIFEDKSIDENGGHFKKFCFDLLQNDFLSTTQQFSGWNASYTISTLLLQVQNFLSIPDMPESHLPDKNKIEELMKSMDDYERIFVIKDENGETIKKHTWKTPYPEMYFKTIEDEKNENKNNNEDNNQELFEDNKIKMIKESLTCFMSRLNYIDNENILLGYPIKKNKFEKINPIPEILSYESYMMQLSNKDGAYINQTQNFHLDERLFEDDFVFVNNRILPDNFLLFENINLNFNNDFDFFNVNNNDFTNNENNIIDINNNYQTFKSANNEYYENWLPIYINEKHYLKNKISILNSFSIIKYGNLGLKEYDFKPENIFDILPQLIYEMTKKMFNNKSSISSSYVICYFQYMLLFQKLFQKFRKPYRKYINNYLDKLLNNNYKEKNDNNDDFDELNAIEKILKLLILLFFANEDPNSKEMQKLDKYLQELKKNMCFDLFMSKKKFEMNKTGLFIDDLFKYDIFYKIVDLIFFNKQFLDNHNWIISKNTRKRIIKKLIYNFKELYNECDYELQSKIKQLINENVDFIKYFDLEQIISKFCNFEDVYEDYNLFLIFFIFKGKMKEKNFFKMLEENYGIYLDVDIFIKEINTKINELKYNLDYNKYFGKLFYKNLCEIVFLHTIKKVKEFKISWDKPSFGRKKFIFFSFEKLLTNYFLSIIRSRINKQLEDKIKCIEERKIIKNRIKKGIFNNKKTKIYYSFKNNSKTSIIKINNNKIYRNGFKKNYR